MDFLAVVHYKWQQLGVISMANDLKWLSVTDWLASLPMACNFAAAVDSKVLASDFMTPYDGWISLLVAVHSGKLSQESSENLEGENFMTRGRVNQFKWKDWPKVKITLRENLWPQLTLSISWMEESSIQFTTRQVSLAIARVTFLVVYAWWSVWLIARKCVSEWVTCNSRNVRPFCTSGAPSGLYSCIAVCLYDSMATLWLMAYGF